MHSFSRLTQFEGDELYAAVEAIVKGLLEATTPVALFALPRREPFGPLLRLAEDEATAALLRAHELRIQPTPTAARAVMLARYAAEAGQGAMAVVPADELAAATGAIARASAALPAAGGALCLLLEDRPAEFPWSSPVPLARDLDLPAIVPADVGSLRSSMSTAPRLSRAVGRAVVLVVHASVLRLAETIAPGPNRVIESVDAMLARRRRGRRPRFAESPEVLRMVRRLEFNRARNVPSPGERTPVGFVTVGPATPALRHVIHTLRLRGRVPLLELGVAHPLDGIAVGRILGRCEQVVVLEPRPGVVAAGVLDVAESMRGGGERPAAVWGRLVPAEADADPVALAADEAVHPSLLARRIVHLLHRIRPTERIAARLTPRPSVSGPPPEERGATVGPGVAAARLRQMAADVDQWLRDQRSTDAADDDDGRYLVIDGAAPASGGGRPIMVEIWEPRPFLQDGVGALRQAARDDRPWIFLVCDVEAGPEQDLLRLARGSFPADRADRVRIEEASLADGARLMELLREAAGRDRVTVIGVRDGSPASCDVAAIERSLAEIDRLGFEPRQRITWRIDRACALRPPPADDPRERRSGLGSPSMHSDLRVMRSPRASGRSFRFAVRPLWEQVEVVRTRPPRRRWQRGPVSKLPVPEIVHRRAPEWRVHLAGFASEPPGVAARILSAAGRRMGYAVSSLHDERPIGAGRRAWGQLLFTKPRRGEAPPPLGVRIPFGGADLLLGVDAAETLRALAFDPALRVAGEGRTYAVVNAGRFRDERDTEAARGLRDQLRAVLRETTRPGAGIVDDFAGACRAWFHTDRVVSVALLGAAFQLGLIPVNADAIEGAIADAEASGLGRLKEAFLFGRHLAGDDRLFHRPRDEGGEDVERVARRMVHLIPRRRWPGRDGPARFARQVAECLDTMPGLTETDGGRQARRDIVVALYRCYHWGGPEYAERYGRLLLDLYRADSGGTGRALTRTAVLPLASAMLIRDPFFVASMATSAEQHRRTRRLLNVKRARDDRLERRYLTRFELVTFGRRIRADLRTSDWAPRVVSAVLPLIPRPWRGTKRERALRDYVVDLIRRTTHRASGDYEHFQNALHRLHQQALEDRLRGMAISEVRILAEGGNVEEATA